jgi:catechol 2,3-dioxygenase-like lactoylglutathione lyase family enzyme
LFDHVTLHAADRHSSERFYRTTLAALGIGPTRGDEDGIEWDDFRIVRADADEPPTRGLHLAFVAASRRLVDDFWQAGTDAGSEDLGSPGERPQYTAGYYGAFLRDPDGNSAEAVHHADVRRGGHIDHLWIRVGDLDAAHAFYVRLAPHLGLRVGRRWDEGRQFRGAWATFSLVADGSAPSEGVRMAFPAPDRQGVEEFHRAAIDAGYLDGAAPTERPDRGRACYTALVLDPAGTVVESVFREPR